MIYYLISAVVAYLLGSINPSVFLGKYFFRQDLRAYGSNNPGAANSIYVYGYLGGIIVLLIDVMKGYAALWIVEKLLAANTAEPLLLLLVTAFFAVLGHSHSLYLKFAGGKGFATFIGITLYLFPASFLFLFFAFVIAVLVSKYISIGTFTVVTLSPLFQLFRQYQSQTDLTYSIRSWVVLAAISLLVVFEHRENVLRLIRREEISIKSPRISTEKLSTPD